MPDRRGPRWRALAVGLVASFMTLLDVSIVNVAIPSIQDGLGLRPSELQWVLSGYALTFGLLLIPAGRFGDARGRRNVFIAGLTLFTLSSAAAGLSRDATWLVIARLAQGAAAGIINPQVSGLIQQLFPPSKRGRPFGLLGATIGVSTAIGPLLGGTLIQLGGSEQGWRWVFYINVPVGIAAIILGRRWLPGHPADQRRRESIDPVGIVLLGAGVVAFLLPLIQEREWQGTRKWLLIPAAVLVLAIFVWWERRRNGRRPALIDIGLFRHRSYALGAVVGLLYFGGFTAIFFIFTLFLQNGLRYSALAAGIAITPFALGSAIAAMLGGRVVTRFGRPMVAAGLCLVATGLTATMVALHYIPGHEAPLVTAGPLLVAGLGSGLVIAPNQALSLAEVPVAGGGSASGVLQTGQRIGAALGIAAVGSVFFAELSSSGQDSTAAFRSALVVAVGFVLIALIAALTDVAIGRRQRAGAELERPPLPRALPARPLPPEPLLPRLEPVRVETPSRLHLETSAPWLVKPSIPESVPPQRLPTEPPPTEGEPEPARPEPARPAPEPERERANAGSEPQPEPDRPEVESPPEAEPAVDLPPEAKPGVESSEAEPEPKPEPEPEPEPEFEPEPEPEVVRSGLPRPEAELPRQTPRGNAPGDREKPGQDREAGVNSGPVPVAEPVRTQQNENQLS